MIPLQFQQPIDRCRSCKAFFWPKEANVLGSAPFNTSGVWKSAPRLQELTCADYFVAISLGIPRNAAEEVILRKLAWWLWNDFYRERRMRFGCLSVFLTFVLIVIATGDHHEKVEFSIILGVLFIWKIVPLGLELNARRKLSAAGKPNQNLQRLLELLDDTEPFDCILKAEAARELGQFDVAIQQLGKLTIDDPGYKRFADSVFAFAKKKDRSVRRIRQSL